MFVDASAIVAIIAGEADADALALKLQANDKRHTSAVAIYESVLALARIGQANVAEVEGIVLEFLERHGVGVIDISPRTGASAIHAFNLYGKGRHRAALNLGDCFSYGCAKVLDVPLLCKGDDFIHTDIKLA